MNNKYICDKYGHKLVTIKCQMCGKEMNIRKNLFGKVTKCCSCVKKTHDLTKKRIYSVWFAMLDRCENPKNISYKNYGGRGIKVCEEWHDVEIFYSWACENGYSEQLTGIEQSIDRIDVNGNYTPSNCKFVSAKEQHNNTRRNKYITYDGVTHTIAEWAEIKGMIWQTLNNRISVCKWSVEDALNKPVRARTK